MATISAIICTKDRHADLANTLASLARQTRPPDEVVIVDASQQPAPASIQQQLQAFAAHRYVQTRPGLPWQRNRGIDESSGELIFFFDDDVLLEPDYTARVAQVFEQDTARRYGGGMGQIAQKPRRALSVHRWLAKIFLLGAAGGDGRFKPSGFFAFPHGAQTFQEVEALSGCCMAFRRQALAQHRCDEALSGYAYMEDLDLSRRVTQDAALFYEPAARLQHLNSPAARDRQRVRAKMLVCNHHYLFKKNFRQTPLARLAHAWSLLGLAVRMLLHRSLPGLLGTVDGWRAVAGGACGPEARQAR